MVLRLLQIKFIFNEGTHDVNVHNVQQESCDKKSGNLRPHQRQLRPGFQSEQGLLPAVLPDQVCASVFRQILPAALLLKGVDAFCIKF